MASPKLRVHRGLRGDHVYGAALCLLLLAWGMRLAGVAGTQASAESSGVGSQPETTRAQAALAAVGHLPRLADAFLASKLLLFEGVAFVAALAAFAVLVRLTWAPTRYVPPPRGSLAERDYRHGRRRVGDSLPPPYPDAWYCVGFAHEVRWGAAVLVHVPPGQTRTLRRPRRPGPSCPPAGS